MTTPILSITEVANNQVNQYLTVNEAIRALESSANAFVTVDLSAGDATISNADPDYFFSRNVLFKSSGNSVARVLTIPAITRLFAVLNGGSATLTVKRGTSEYSVSAAHAILFYADGTTNGLIAIAGGVGGSAEIVSVSSSAGVLDLSSVEVDSVQVTLSENITSVVYPDGIADRRRDLIIRLVQDSTGGRTVDLSGISWDGDGSPPAIGGTPGDVTYITATNFNDGGWEGFK